MTKLGAKELRKTPPSEKQLAQIKKNPIYFVLDRVLDTYNIGSLFRLADAIAAEKIYLCGEMEYPPSSRIHKSAVGTEVWVAWEKRDTAIEVIRELRDRGIQIIAIEQDPRSIPLSTISPKFPLALVVGHETDGISKEVLDEADIIVELPQYGVNKSFNVWGSAAVVAYRVIEKLNSSDV